MTRRTRWALVAAAALAVALAAVRTVVEVEWQLPSWAAGALLHPLRLPVIMAPPAGCEDATFQGVGVVLKGWRCRAVGERAGTLVFLHGVGNNRTGAAGLVPRFASRGLDLIAYDSRANGQSGGDACTYGYWEKEDLRRVIDSIPPGPVVLLGTSLGAAVALQEAAGDTRVVGVVSAGVFSDLRTVARERAPVLLSQAGIRQAFSIAEQRGRFRVDAVSPVDAARRIHIPVLLIHGAEDRETRPDHSRRVLAALAGPKELILVPGAGHNDTLRPAWVWQRIEAWVDSVLKQAAKVERTP